MTCQTVLIHVPDVARVLREFMRVLNPGGQLLVAEPNNLADSLAVGSARHDDPIDDRVELLRAQLVCERSKVAMGEGDNSVGDVLPGLVAAAGFEIALVLALRPRAASFVPPYAGDDQRATRDELLDLDARGFWIWSRDETLRYYLAGGGADGFDALWTRCRRARARDVEALRRGSFTSASRGRCTWSQPVAPSRGERPPTRAHHSATRSIANLRHARTTTASFFSRPWASSAATPPRQRRQNP